MKDDSLYNVCDVQFTGNNQPKAVGATIRCGIHDYHRLDKKGAISRVLPKHDGTWAGVENTRKFFDFIQQTRAWQTSQAYHPPLTSLPLHETQVIPELPYAAGIYFLLQDAVTLYIGSTRNLRQRVAAHEIVRTQQSITHLCVAYFTLQTPNEHEKNWREFIERCLIWQHEPALNIAFTAHATHWRGR